MSRNSFILPFYKRIKIIKAGIKTTLAQLH